MKSVIFSTGNRSFQASSIVYAGPVQEIPPERRRNGSTYSFKMLTSLGATYCYYKDAESARKARGALGAMLDTIKPKAFKHGNEYINPQNVVSFSTVVEFRKKVGEYTHGFVVTVQTSDEKNREIWLRYRNEDHARKGRKVMWAAVHTANGFATTTAKQAKEKEPAMQEVAAESVPF